MNKQIEQYFDNNLNADEQLELLKKIKSDSELKKEFANYQNTHALLALSDGVVDLADSKRGYNSFLLRIKRQKAYRIMRKTIGYAAAIALIVLSVNTYHTYYTTQPNWPVNETSLFVPAGQRVSLTLPDGTVVWLNSQSRLTYPTAFMGKERKVKVEGEAYFEVAHDKEQPFIVSSGGVDVKVLGTTFNICNYATENSNRISLIEGSVRVYNPSSASGGVILRPNEEVIITDEKMTVAAIPNNDYFLWKDGIYSFENESFEVILKKLELYYDIEIVVNDSAMLEWKYTVKFRQRDGIDEILRLLRKIHPFQIHKDEENNRITIK